MKIKPVKKYSGILPAAAALLGSMVTGCDRQNVVGSVPNPNPQDTPSSLPAASPELPDSSTGVGIVVDGNYDRVEPELPQRLGGVMRPDMGSIETGVVGSVPNPNPKDTPSQLPGEPPEPETPSCPEPIELPQVLGGDIPVENLNIDRDN